MLKGITSHLLMVMSESSGMEAPMHSSMPVAGGVLIGEIFPLAIQIIQADKTVKLPACKYI
jgi:hypothetical protein